MKNVKNSTPEALICLDALINEINDDLTIGCQLPFTVPKKELARIINRAKDYFYKIYEDSVEEMYIALPASAWAKDSFKKGITDERDVIGTKNIESTRGIVPMPPTVYSVNNVFEWRGFAGEDGGWSTNSFSAGDVDFSIERFIYSDTYGPGLGAENLMAYVINSKFLDVTRQILLPQISYSYNRLTKKFRFQGELPKHACIFQVYNTVPDCALFQDDFFIRYCIAKAKVQLARILGTFSFNLPGNITINYDMIASEGQEELSSIIEEIKGDEGVDYFYTG
jgi:hypothetical protein